MDVRRDLAEQSSVAGRDLAIGIYLTMACSLELVAEWLGLPQLSGIALSTAGLWLSSALASRLGRRPVVTAP